MVSIDVIILAIISPATRLQPNISHHAPQGVRHLLLSQSLLPSAVDIRYSTHKGTSWERASKRTAKQAGRFNRA